MGNSRQHFQSQILGFGDANHRDFGIKNSLGIAISRCNVVLVPTNLHPIHYSILVGSSVLARLTLVTNEQTHVSRSISNDSVLCYA